MAAPRHRPISTPQRARDQRQASPVVKPIGPAAMPDREQDDQQPVALAEFRKRKSKSGNVQKKGRGGRTHGKTVEQHIADGTYRPDRHDPDWAPKPKPITLVDSAEWMAERIGLSPRMAALRPDLAERFDVLVIPRKCGKTSI